jgi:antitoxin Phd
MNNLWQLQDAKNRFSEVIEHALKDGPQEITRRGKKTAVVVAIDDYRKIKRGKESLVDFFRRSPLGDIDITRDKSSNRKIEL